jgi:medium-chain acyl-[acyl-carrier-protein] hydrolase
MTSLSVRPGETASTAVPPGPGVLDAASRWLPTLARLRTGELPLFCLPHAGAGASAFRAYPGDLPGVAVLPVQPPGRESRFREQPFERMEPLASELATVLLSVTGTRRYAVYGHSLGALVAFETLREIRRRGGQGPMHLFVSGCVAPQYACDDGEPVASAPLERVVEMLRDLGGTPDWLLSDPNALEMIVPPVRADFSVKESYEYRPGPPLDVPVTVLASTDDPRAPYERQDRWRDQTTAAFRLHKLIGGHFAVFEQPASTRRYLAAALAGRA